MCAQCNRAGGGKDGAGRGGGGGTGDLGTYSSGRMSSMCSAASAKNKSDSVSRSSIKACIVNNMQ